MKNSMTLLLIFLFFEKFKEKLLINQYTKKMDKSSFLLKSIKINHEFLCQKHKKLLYKFNIEYKYTYNCVVFS